MQHQEWDFGTHQVCPVAIAVYYGLIKMIRIMTQW